MRLIDADALYMDIIHRFDYCDDFLEMLESAPTAQPEIVRCKDCKHQPFDSEDTQGFGVEFPDEMCPCQCDDFWYSWRPNDEWFCGNGERRTDGE